MLKFFQAFITDMKARFASISKSTRSEISVEELQSDAWIAADEIGKKRGREIDFSAPQDRHLILGALYIRNVKRPEKNVRYAVRSDASTADDEGERPGWTDRLCADDAADPLISLLLREDAVDPEIMLANSYSEASAYVRVFRHFQGDRDRVCAYLIISDRVLGRRVTHATNTVRLQPSVFDRIERIDANFMPMPGKAYGAAGVDAQIRETTQQTFAF